MNKPSLLIKSFITFTVIVISLILVVNTALAASPVTKTKKSTEQASVLGFSISIVPYKCWQSETGCNICDIALIFTNASNLIAMALSGTALLMFIVGGMFWIFSNGNEQRIERGKQILTGTVIGLGIVFLAWFLVNVIVRIAASSSSSGKTTLFDAKTGWWVTPACLPSETSCAGKYVGDACGTVGECTSKNQTGCICYRKINKDGDNLACASDVNKLTDAKGDKKPCYCAAGCSLLNEIKLYRDDLREYNWKCVPTPKDPTELDKYTMPPFAVACSDPKQTCVGEDY